MFVAKVPLRISLLGGGLDFPEYLDNFFVATLGFTINQYVYTSFKLQYPLYGVKFRTGFSNPGYYKSVAEIENPLVKEIFQYFKIDQHCEIQTLSDLPSSSGLGGSSSFCVGLLMILNRLFDKKISQRDLIDLAIKLERQSNNFMGGFQDQYHVGNEGLNLIRYQNDKHAEISNISGGDIDTFAQSCTLAFLKNPSANTVGNRRGIGAKGLQRDISGALSKLCEQAYKKNKTGELSKGYIKSLFEEACDIKRLYDPTYEKNLITNYLEENNIRSWKYCGAPGGNAIFIFEDLYKIEKIKKDLRDDTYFVPLNFGSPRLLEV